MTLCEASVMRYVKPDREKKSSRSLGSFHTRLPCAGTHLSGCDKIDDTVFSFQTINSDDALLASVMRYNVPFREKEKLL